MKNAKKMTAAFVSLLLILTMGVGGTLAFLIHEADPVVNEFQGVDVDPSIEETFPTTRTLKTNVQIKNTGDVDAFIRVALVVTWQKEDGTVAPDVPKLGEDYVMEMGSSGNWKKASDGFYYYKNDVASGQSTDILIKEAYQKQEYKDTDYTLHIEIVTNTIQADYSGSGDHPAKQHWGVTVAQDGTISKG